MPGGPHATARANSPAETLQAQVHVHRGLAKDVGLGRPARLELVRLVKGRSKSTEIEEGTSRNSAATGTRYGEAMVLEGVLVEEGAVRGLRRGTGGLG